MKREPPTAPPIRPTNGPDWQMIALWIFVVFDFVALVFVVYVIWAKCQGDSAF